MNKIIIASKNRGKVYEIKKILSLSSVEIVDLHSMGFKGTIHETGSTFMENALIKARQVYQKYSIPALADDSGLAVDRLGGQPGVYSARFAGPDATDEQNNNLLLSRLQGVPPENRKASFICIAVFYFDEEKYAVEEGKVEGTITYAPRGKNGFGYDPLFYIPRYRRTLAELTDNQKNQISHRGKAFRKIKKRIQEYYSNDE
ncbi:MAG: XTP/dITP diphosphatase [Spirochaetota bacterium]